ncbi:hypothetical protein RND71_015815 [Anisodus tanguticus]|uniref:Uncharacterized protein n=1 Tax=Anisodus tanguticus TaxID=243964 RepID=A0AAE1S7T1_9SOLA|nr:hypothetical protein RND71_015815 [Anisodus tanguticus]
MATAPVKSQPLHYFSIPQLKWGTNKTHTTTNHRDSPPSTAIFDGGSDSDKLPPRLATDPNGEDEHEQEEPDVDGGSSSPCSSEKQKQDLQEKEEKMGCEEGEVKLWNLRTRSKGVETVSLKKVEMGVETSHHIQRSQRLKDNNNNNLDGRGGVGSGKRKLWISLSKEEIEEDVYSMTGSRPSRRPKKRSKIVQKQLDNAFPGLYLVGLTADSFRVNDTTVYVYVCFFF